MKFDIISSIPFNTAYCQMLLINSQSALQRCDLASFQNKLNNIQLNFINKFQLRIVNLIIINKNFQ